MARNLLVDLNSIDLDAREADITEIRKANRQRYEMEQLSAIVKFDPEEGYVVALKEVRDDEFWVRGHIPGRPIMPGVLICECAAQTCSYYYMRTIGHESFLGFGGMNNVKFRDVVKPGDKLYIIAKPIDIRRRISRFQTQGVVDGKTVFEAEILGIIL